MEPYFNIVNIYFYVFIMAVCTRDVIRSPDIRTFGSRYRVRIRISGPDVRIKYYIDHFTGMCIDVTDGRSPPHYITVTYTDYWTCCAHSFMRDKCLEEGPTRIPTNGPTFIESLMPSTSPTISQSPSDFDGPTNSPTALYWGKFFLLMCHICSKTWIAMSFLNFNLHLTSTSIRVCTTLMLN